MCDQELVNLALIAYSNVIREDGHCSIRKNRLGVESLDVGNNEGQTARSAGEPDLRGG